MVHHVKSMGAFMAVETAPGVICNYILSSCLFIYKVLGQTLTSHDSFSQVTPFGVLGVVLKRTEMFVL